MELTYENQKRSCYSLLHHEQVVAASSLHFRPSGGCAIVPYYYGPGETAAMEAGLELLRWIDMVAYDDCCWCWGALGGL